jgi:hypothetical protein
VKNPEILRRFQDHKVTSCRVPLVVLVQLGSSRSILAGKSSPRSPDPAIQGSPSGCNNVFLQNKPNSLGGAYEILPKACEEPASNRFQSIPHDFHATLEHREQSEKASQDCCAEQKQDRITRAVLDIGR